MTAQENQALQQLLSQLVQIKGIPKDPEAERMIANAVAQQPDAAYLLVQRAMLLEQALDAAKAQISRLESQAKPAAGGTDFLDANAWGRAATASSAIETSVTGRPLGSDLPAPQAAPMAAFGRTAAPGFLGGAGGSMLGTLAATAAGVAGGAFLFHGIGNLLGNQQDGSKQEQAGKEPAGDQAPAEEASAQNQDTAASDAQLADNTAEDNYLADDGSSADSGLDSGFDEL